MKSLLRSKPVDMLHGDLFRTILLYAIPILLIGLVQSLFNSVDLMVLGIMADTQAVASVGATSSIIFLFINTFFGFSSGAKIVLARLLGANDEVRIQKTVSTSMLLSVFLGGLIAIAGFFLSGAFLTLTDCPAECFADAQLYMQIYLAAAPAIMVYNFGTAILTASGDSQRPLNYMLISGGLNVVLNFLLCLIMPQKVIAVAVSTAASQLVGAVLVIMRLLKADGPCRLELKQLRWSNSAFQKLVVNGVPIALQSALYPIANLQIQTQVNLLGTATIAGNSAMSSIEGVLGTTASNPWATSTTAFVCQNLGADQPERVKRSILYHLAISTTLGLVMGVGGVACSHLLVAPFVHYDETAIQVAQIRMWYTLLPYALSCINNVLVHVIQSFGWSIFGALNSVISVLLFRIFWMNTVYPMHPTFAVICQCYLVSWVLMLIVNTTCVLYLYNGRFKKGKLKKM